MISVIHGDLFESKAQTLVNTVNCVGIMGKGVALEFKKRFPDMFEDYVGRCKNKQVHLGQPYLFKRVLTPWILNFPTKDHWRTVSRLQDITEGLLYLKQHYQEWGITSLAVPPLGCGQGQLEWRAVGPALYRHLKAFDIPIELYAPYDTPQVELEPAFLDKQQPSSLSSSAPDRIGAPWMAIVEILYRIEDEPYHWPVGRTTFQKIAYFATVCGLPTNLNFQRGSYGPYASELKPRISALVNNGLLLEEPLGQMILMKVGPAFQDARVNYQQSMEQWIPIIDKVVDLFMRINTRQAELAATIHFAAKELEESSEGLLIEKAILDAVMNWKQRRKPPLDIVEAALTVRNLNILGWIEADISYDMPIREEEDILHV